jgi:SagB-type dehydrogenase family enzyme
MAMSKLKEIQLPQPKSEGKISLEETILKRRSQRNFMNKDLKWDEVGQLLWAAQGITQAKGGFSLRAAPSAGALYPMEIYLLKRDGLFHYVPQGHKLEVIKEEDLRGSLAGVALHQDSISQAAIDIVISCVYDRITAKYGQRGIRYVHIEAGHIAQNIHLQAVALGLGSVPIGAFNDAEAKRILSLPQDEEPLYIIPVGYPD